MEVTVVGAGLAGLTAAINCAKAGHDVTVLERFTKIGGLPRVHPAVDGTPMDTHRLGEFIGVELKQPQVKPAEEIAMYTYDECFLFPPAYLFNIQTIERGGRSTALDAYLYRIAQDLGVKFEFGWELRTKRDAMGLPPNSIIATGLYFEPFEALGIPYTQLYGYVAKGKMDGPARFAGWFDTYTNEYCYYGRINGIIFGLCFDKKPVDRSLRERWGSQLMEQEGVEFSSWHDHEGVAPVKKLDNCRLFWGDKILAGTLSGMQDPFMLFGVHSALVSGKIAAVAVDDKFKAYQLFKLCTSSYKYSFVAKKIFDYWPHQARKAAFKTFMGLFIKYPGALAPAFERALRIVPGYRRI